MRGPNADGAAHHFCLKVVLMCDKSEFQLHLHHYGYVHFKLVWHQYFTGYCLANAVLAWPAHLAYCTRQSKSLCKLVLFLQSLIYGADVKVKESKSKVKPLKNKLCS